MIKKLVVGRHIERPEQDVREVEPMRAQGELFHVAAEKREMRVLRPLARRADHLPARVEAKVTVAALVPFLEIGASSGSKLKDAPDAYAGELPDRRLEEVHLLRDVTKAERDLVVLRALVDVHVVIVQCGGVTPPLADSVGVRPARKGPHGEAPLQP